MKTIIWFRNFQYWRDRRAQKTSSSRQVIEPFQIWKSQHQNDRNQRRSSFDSHRERRYRTRLWINVRLRRPKQTVVAISSLAGELSRTTVKVMDVYLYEGRKKNMELRFIRSIWLFPLLNYFLSTPVLVSFFPPFYFLYIYALMHRL